MESNENSNLYRIFLSRLLNSLQVSWALIAKWSLMMLQT